MKKKLFGINVTRLLCDLLQSKLVESAFITTNRISRKLLITKLTKLS